MIKKAVILAGGLGSRLEPFTKIIPKPLLPVGESSVLEIQILTLKKYGVKEIIIATNYMSEYVEAYLGDGGKYDIRISFSKESKPLGTCGPVKILQEQLTEPFLLMNGDILTTLNLEELYRFSRNIDANLVVVTKEIVAPFNFGKVVSEADFIVNVEEKPDFKIEILAGIYVIKPPLFKIIPGNTYYGIDTLIKEMLTKKMPIAKYLMKEYWLDIGRINDYQIAQDAYNKHFNGLKANAK